MNVGDIRAGMRNISVVAKVDSIGETRTVNLKNGGTNTVADAVISDASGNIKMSLWGDDVSKFRVGDKVKIENAYVNTYKGENTLAVGKFGRLTRV